MRTVLCYGDSNTHGTKPMASLVDAGRWDRDTRWPGALRRLAPGWEVIEEGLPARTLVHDDPTIGPHVNGLTMLMGALHSHRPLDAVVLMLGTNDLKPRFALSAEEIALSLVRLVRAVSTSMAGHNWGAPKVLVLSPVPVEEAGCLSGHFRDTREKSRALYGHLRAFVPPTGASLIDLAPLAKVDMLDGVHLGAEAHAAIAGAVAGWLETI